MQRYFKRACNFYTLLGVFGISCLLHGTTVLAAELALVIDDVGYSKSRGMRAAELPGAITLGVLPFAPHTASLMQHAARHGKDVIVHQPMQAQPGPHVRREQGTLTLDMAPLEFAATFSAALDAVPSRVGVSNHTGSLLTTYRAPMQHLMREISQRGLFFLDSRTSADTVALTVAREAGVPALRRDVFLDHVRTPAAIHNAFDKALRIAHRKGHAVVIAHPYRMTLNYLEKRLADLPNGVQTVSLAELAARPAALKRAEPPTVLAQPPGLTNLHISPGQ